MSRYPMPFLSENQGCFCCEPAVPSNTAQSGILSQHLQGQGTVVASTENEAGTHLFSTNATDLSSLLQRVHLNSPYSNSLTWQCLPENNMADQSIQVCDMHQNQNNRRMFITSNYTTNSGNHETSQSSAMNFCILQCRVDKLSGNMHAQHNDQKSVLSSSSTPIRSFKNIVLPDHKDSQRGSIKVNIADSMDLDSALDELGMLSTITNSRRQYLIETQGQASLMKREQRLRSKSESSPNLTTLGRPNGYRIVHLDTNFITGLTDTFQSSNQASIGLGDDSPLKSQPSRLEYRNSDVLEEASRGHRSVPRMSRMRKDRYRRSRCPYKIPNRLCSSMQESDFGPDYFETCTSPFITSSSASETGVNTLSDTLTNAQCLLGSKSNTASPVKPHHELRLIRSLSAENLTPLRCHLELNEQMQESSRAEQSLDLMTSQMTNLHMS